MCVLLLPEGQTGECRETSEKQCTLGSQRALDRKELPLYALLLGKRFQYGLALFSVDVDNLIDFKPGNNKLCAQHVMLNM